MSIKSSNGSSKLVLGEACTVGSSMLEAFMSVTVVYRVMSP